jgi:hypothetical protein
VPSGLSTPGFGRWRQLLEANMDRDLNTNTAAPADEDAPEAKWIAWGMWSGISLVMVLLAVLVAGMDTGLLLGWALGVIIAAMLMLFRR